MRYSTFVVLVLMMLIFFGCGSASAPSNALPPTLVNAGTQPTPAGGTPAPVSTRVERRAPTLAPATATSLPTVTPLPTDVPTALPSPTVVPPSPTTSRPATSPTTARPAASPTPNIAAGVYVTALTLEPPQPKSRAEFVFHIKFLNTTGTPVPYARIRVLIFPKGETKSTGDPQSDVSSIPSGASDLVTRTWNINTPINCQSFAAQPVWEDDAGRRTALTQVDGKPVMAEFEVCP